MEGRERWSGKVTYRIKEKGKELWGRGAGEMRSMGRMEGGGDMGGERGGEKSGRGHWGRWKGGGGETHCSYAGGRERRDCRRLRR